MADGGAVDRLVFFVDRSLGRYEVPQVFAAAGFDVVLMAELYPDGADQEIADERWISDVSGRGWVALTKDPSIRYAHTDALADSTLRVFALPNANMAGAVMAQRFRDRLEDIVGWATSTGGPYVVGVYRDRLERRWP
jgi:PIN like domain